MHECLSRFGFQFLKRHQGHNRVLVVGILNISIENMVIRIIEVMFLLVMISYKCNHCNASMISVRTADVFSVTTLEVLEISCVLIRVQFEGGTWA